MKRTCGWIGCLVVMAACGGDDVTPGDDAAIATGIVGSWVRVPVVGFDGVERVTFTAGGTFTAEGSFGTDTGSYQIDPSDWLVISGTHWRSEGEFLLDGNQLLAIAYLPDGPHAGLIGTWTAHYEAGGALVDERVLLSGDGSASLTTITRDSEQTDPGTWTAETGGFVLDFGVAAPAPMHFRTLGDNAAVGTQRFDRAP